MLQAVKETVKRLLGLAKKKPANLIAINVEKLERRVALLEDGILEEFSVERASDKNIVGGIFKGRVKNIENGLKAMFVDIGFDKNAFLHFWDALPAALDSGIEEIARENKSGKPKAPKKPQVKDIPSIYPVGSEVIVQVTKGPIGTKGPRVTTNISLAGRYLVLMPYSDQSGISRKIDDPKERDRLRKILRELDIPDGMGVIMRTVGEGQRSRFFVRDLSLLLEQWRAIEEGLKTKHAPACLFQEPDLIERTVRDFLTDEIDRVVCDDEASVKRMQDLVGQISKRSRSRIEWHQGQVPIFENYRVEKQIEDAYHRQVWLPCGGYIVIDETEALIAIDVNTGRNKGGGKDMEKTILQTNLEAADEIARQLRLRNVGGLIICDFIDMKHRRDQQAVYDRMKERLKRDKAKTHVLPISALGLMEMTRQRAQESISSTMFTTCPHCNGRGRVKSPESLSVELQRTLHSILRKHRNDVHEYKVIIHPEVMQRLRTIDEDLLVDLERKYECRLTFRTDPQGPLEKFSILDAMKNTELRG